MLNNCKHSPGERCGSSASISKSTRILSSAVVTSVFAAALTGAALTGAASSASASYPYWNGIGTLGPLAWTERTDVAYAWPSNGSKLDKVDICEPNPGGSQWSGPYPAIMLIHGGGWDGGSNAIGTSYTGYSSSWCQIWASWGFVAYSVGYRLQDGSSGNAWPAQLIDVQAAVRWVRARAADGNPDNVNPKLMGAMGDSAGASLAMQVGSLSSNVKSGDPVASTNADRFPKVQFMVSQFGPYTWGPNSSNAPLPDVTIPTAEWADGGAHPPASSLFIQGSYDTTVSPSQSIAAFCYLSGQGNVTDYLSYPGAHEYSDIANGSFKPVVGSMIMGAISFGMSAGHWAPSGARAPIPSSFASPHAAFRQSDSPSCN